MIWSYDLVVDSHDVDYNGVVKSSSLMRYMQEAGFQQLQTLGPTPDQLRQSGRAFLLSRAALSVYGIMRRLDKLTVQTWACESKGASFIRSARIYRGETLMCEMVTIWALVDFTKGQLLRVSDLDLPFPVGTPLDLVNDIKLRIPGHAALNLVGEFHVGYSWCDENMHMNNTRYPDMFADFLSTLEGQRIVNIIFSYAAEAKLGEVLKIFRSEPSEEGKVYFRAVGNDDKVRCEAEIIIEMI